MFWVCFMNNHEAIEQFRDAMLDSIGYAPNYIIGDGVLHRIKDDNGKLNGAYVLHLDGKPAGYFQCHKKGIKQTWKMAGNIIPLSAMQQANAKAKYHQEAEQRQKNELAKQAESARKAFQIWNTALDATDSHPYLIAKHIGAKGLRIGRENTLIIPLYNPERQLVNLQFISETGGKRFLSGGKKKGCFYWLGEEETSVILICEGFATGASLHNDSNLLTVIAFDAGNLKDVAIAVKTLSPESEIIVCGDNDASGVGQTKAIDAALAIGGKYLIPETMGHDWNDALTAVIL
jgi:putative DNA primase/helicase